MDGRLRLNLSATSRPEGNAAWVGMAALLAAASGWAALNLGFVGPADAGVPTAADAWAWHRAAAVGWSAWTAALVHLGPWHLAANLLAAAVVAAWGFLAGCRWPQACAWCLAWPLTHTLLVTDPGTLARYAGLSATLHAGVAIGCWHLMVHARGAPRWVGGAVAAAVALKMVTEVPAVRAVWSGVPLSALPVLALPGAPGHILAGHAHGCGVVAGLAAAAAVDGIIALARRFRRRVPPR